MEKIRIGFYGGEGHRGGAFNFMETIFKGFREDDECLYAEYDVQDGDDEMAGYDECKAEIIRQAAERGIPEEMLEFC